MSRSPGELDEIHIRLGKTGRVANRKAQSVIIRPKDPYRYGYHLWADIDTGLLLKAYLIDHHGSILEQFMFTQYPSAARSPTPTWNRRPRAAVCLVSRAGADRHARAGRGRLTVTQLPKGFILSRMLRKLANREPRSSRWSIPTAWR